MLVCTLSTSSRVSSVLADGWWLLAGGGGGKHNEEEEERMQMKRVLRRPHFGADRKGKSLESDNTRSLAAERE